MSPAATSRSRSLGILFKGEMVRSILNTTAGIWPPVPVDPQQPFKGVTRRIVDLTSMHPQGRKLWDSLGSAEQLWCLNNDPETLLGVTCNFGPVGRRLYVKETFYRNSKDGFISFAATPAIARNAKGKIVESVDWDDAILKGIKANKDWKCKPSIFMSRKESRIELEVMELRAERLQDITEEQAQLEGVRAYSKQTKFIEIQPLDGMSDFKAAYRELWDKINGAGSWDRNPFVWAIAFKRT